MKVKKLLMAIVFLFITFVLISCDKKKTETPVVTPETDVKTPVETLEPTVEPEVITRTTAIVNGGFETGDLSGWTVLSGNAFNDDSVTSRKSFSYSYDKYHNEIPYNHSGNWYLSGKGFDLSHSNYRTGVIKSSNFYLEEDGILKMKIAGGALKAGRGQNAADKKRENICLNSE